MKLVIALIALTVVASHPEKFLFEEFSKFVQTHNKEYTTIEEFNARFTTFKQNYERLHAFNADPDLTYTVGVNKFSDLTEQEFRRTYLNLDITSLDINAKKSTWKVVGDTPASKDWRAEGKVTPVKDQGSCGSCWAFSTVGNLEGLHAIKNNRTDGEFVTFSEQQLVDCDKVSSGCNGGLMRAALDYIQTAGGIELSSDYKYTARNGKCSFDASKVALKITGFTLWGQFGPDSGEKQLTEAELKNLVATVGPVSIAVNANSFGGYSRGILNNCPSTGLNHGVTLVGYGVENGNEYWIVKNSWGASWGEAGYIRLKYGVNACGLTTYVTSATLE